MPDISNTVQSIMSMTSTQLTAVVVLATGAVSLAFWVENRYAKLQSTQQNIQQQQTQIIQLQTQILNVVNALPADTRKEIIERGHAQAALAVNRDRFIPQN